MKELHIAILLLLPLLAACSGHGFLPDEPATEERDSLVTVAFRFTIPTAAFPGTRGDYTYDGSLWNDGTDTQWENYIGIPNEDFCVYVVDQNHLHFFTLSPQADTEGVESVTLNHLTSPTSYEYEFRSMVTKDIVEKITSDKFGLIMEANWYYGNQGNNGTYAGSLAATGGYRVVGSGVSVTNSINGDTFTWNHKPLSASHTIPMHGAISNIGKPTYTPGGVLDCGTLYLLRSLAKIEICLSDEVIANGYTIEQCSLVNYNKSGHYTPYNDRSNGWIWAYDTKKLFYNYDGGMLHPQPSKESEPAALELSSGHYRAFIYTPEIDAGSEGTLLKDLELHRNGKHFNTYWSEGMKLADFSNDFSEIRRNHCYRIIITDAGSHLYYTVCRWDEKTAGDITFN